MDTQSLTPHCSSNKLIFICLTFNPILNELSSDSHDARRTSGNKFKNPESSQDQNRGTNRAFYLFGYTKQIACARFCLRTGFRTSLLVRSPCSHARILGKIRFPSWVRWRLYYIYTRAMYMYTRIPIHMYVCMHVGRQLRVLRFWSLFL